MRIGYVHSRGFPSVEANVVQVVQMCRALASLGHEVTLFIPRAETYSSDAAARADIPRLLGEQLTFEIVLVPRVKILGRLEVLGSVRGTLNALRQHQLDLIYTRNPWSVLFLPRAGVPYIFEAHEEKLHDRSRLLGEFLKRRIVRNSHQPSCALVVTISEELRKIWEGYGVPHDKLLAAHDAVELEMFSPSLTKNEAREELYELHPSSLIPHPSPIVVYTGALKSDRGIDLVLDAAQVLPGLQFYFVGGSAQEISHWKSVAGNAHLGNVHFPGKVPRREIPLWLAAADILLMMWTWKVPTIRGCSPMKMFEYMAANRLIVGPAFPTICEVLENGKDSILFEPDNTEALIASLKQALSKLSDPSLPHAAYEKVARDYTWRARCRRILVALSTRS
jgi:glycosyltransferase involved in cell wall biosynthesis